MYIAALAIGLVLQEGPSYVVGGDKIPVQVPTWTSALPLDVVGSDGWKYGFANGEVVAKGKAGLGWEDVPASGMASSAKKRILFNLVVRTDTVSDIGFRWQRQGSIFTEDFRAIKREVALFCHLANTLAPGNPLVQPVWRVDETTRLIDAPGNLGRPYLETFMNAANTAADVLGPVDFAFVLDPTFERSATYGSIDNATSVALPVYAAFDRARPGQLARAMYNAYLGADQKVPQSLDAPIGAGPIPLVTPDAGSVAAYNGQMPTSSNSALVHDGKLFVRRAFSSLFQSKLSRQPIGQGGPWVVFDAGGLPAGQNAGQMLGVQPGASGAASADLPFTPGQAERLATGGTFSVKTSADPERGAVGEVKEMSIRRSGWLQLLGSFDGTKSDSVEFWVKPRGTVWPTDLVALGDGKVVRFRMFGTAETLPLRVVGPDTDVAGALDVRPDSSWQRVALKHGLRSVQGVFLAPPPNAGADEMPRTGLPVLMLDDVAAKSNVEPTPTLAMEPPTDTPYIRALTAATTTDEAALLKLLEDASDVARLNAASRFASIKNPASVPGLTLVARHYNPRLAEAGARALAHQGTEAAWGALRYNYQNALGDYVKQFTAQVLPAIDDRKILSELPLAINSRRPETRAAAARALARQPFKEAALVLLTFLSDADPLVRAAAIEGYPDKQPTGLARIVAAARTDSFDFVRIAAFKKLKGWGAPEAADAAKDPSPRVRSSVQ